MLFSTTAIKIGRYTVGWGDLLSLVICWGMLFTVLPVRAELDGGELYHDYCSVCHGDNGDGVSRARQGLTPPPLDFTTPKAAVELTQSRMVKAVTRGKPGTAMSGWSPRLSEEQILAVVEYVRNNFMMSATTEEFMTGRRVYAEYCSVCHGDKGEGSVWAMQGLNPRPRNFTLAGVRGDLNRERMIFSITYGRPETAMSAWGGRLSDTEVASVVDYILEAFMGVNANAVAAATDKIGVAKVVAGDDSYPDGLKGNAKRGAAFYLSNCTACHGVDGDGQGPRAYFVFPKPRNFHQPASKQKFTRGYLFNAISKGSLKTEMPAWETVLDEQKIADISEYIRLVFIEWDCRNDCILEPKFQQLPDPQ